MTAFDYRSGRHPVDARLSPALNGWQLDVRVRYRFESDPQDSVLLEQRKSAALRGIKAWQGIYLLTSGERIHVRILLHHSPTKRNAVMIALHAARPFNAVRHTPEWMDHQCNRLFSRSYGFRLCDLTERLGTLLPFRRRTTRHKMRWDHFSLMGLDWQTCTSPDLGENLAKHEFGHMLGLGDLYKDLSNVRWLRLPGVAPEHFPVLTPHYDPAAHRFHAVMDDNGDILPSDIEMVIEAFWSGRRQNYQPQPLFGSAISSVLTRSR